MLDDDDIDRLRQMADLLDRRLRLRRPHPANRFVQQQERRPGCQRDTDLQQGDVAVRQGARRQIAQLFKSGLFQYLIDAFGGRLNRLRFEKGCITPSLACAAIQIFSATVMESNTLFICSDRLMPRRLILCGAIPEMSVPRNRTVPESDLSIPDIALNKVVLPAPFGPMIACNTFASKSSVT